MAASKREKKVKQKEFISSKEIAQKQSPDQYYSEHPSWSFVDVDTELWGFTESRIGDMIWKEILPYLQALEGRTWSDILIVAKKQNHSIEPESLSKAAQDRLFNRHLEAAMIISLRLTGSHRLYGYIVDSTFHILWYDDDHGDNDRCVCRSYLKHT